MSDLIPVTAAEASELLRRMLTCPAGPSSQVVEHVRLTLAAWLTVKIPAPTAEILERVETYKQGLHQAKFEYQVLQTDLHKLEKENEYLRQELLAKSNTPAIP